MFLFRKRTFAEQVFRNDDAFTSYCPEELRPLAKKHFTQLKVIKKAARFLAEVPCVHILDIGSGVGKFCLAAAHYQPAAFYTGIEQRTNLTEASQQLQAQLGFTNVAFKNGNFMQLDFGAYDHFYFYNSFYENLDGIEKMDDSLAYSTDIYKQYSASLHDKLATMPPGTRLATYHSTGEEIPQSYRLRNTMMDGRLKFWVNG